ncbi:MAG: alpha/beta hydrolase [Solirubrobacterales bacterium]
MRSGNEPRSGTYFEVLGEGGPAPAVLMIHGGGATGGCFRHDLAGGAGWADLLAERGHEVWVVDWPGCGRSGGRQVAELDYADVVDGIRAVLRDVIAKPAVVVPHSMGGAIAWQLVERDPDLVAGVVSVAAAAPGNLDPSSTVLDDDGRTIRVRFDPSGAEFTIDRRRGYLYEDDYVYRQGIGASTRFPRDRVDEFRAGLVPFPPQMLLQRLGVAPGLPAVAETGRFAGMGVRLVAGTEDRAHGRDQELSTVALLASWGAEAELVWLGDRAIAGNGHFMMFEENSREVLAVIADQVEAVGAGRG